MPDSHVGWFNTLAQVLRENPAQPKVLLCPSYIQGHIWIERIAKNGGPVVNVKVETIESLAHRAAQFTLIRDGIKVLPDTSITWIVHAIVQDLAESFPSVVEPSLLTPRAQPARDQAIGCMGSQGRHSGAA